jgi:pimeloyl-ACP methyl ester carboxylesterase
MTEPLLTICLPGLDGTGRLFGRFAAAGTGALELRVIEYPRDRYLPYAALHRLVEAALPADRPFALLGESFGGPLALRVAAGRPAGLTAVVLAASFHRRPAAPAMSVLRLLSPAFFRLPLPAHAVRLLLGGADCADDLVREVQEAVASVRGSVMSARASEAMDVDATAALRACPVPLLFLGGKGDRLLRTGLPIEVRALRADAEIRMLDAPHLVLQRRPAEAMRIVEDFLLRRGAVAGAA